MNPTDNDLNYVLRSLQVAYTVRSVLMMNKDRTVRFKKLGEAHACLSIKMAEVTNVNMMLCWNLQENLNAERR